MKWKIYASRHVYVNTTFFGGVIIRLFEANELRADSVICKKLYKIALFSHKSYCNNYSGKELQKLLGVLLSGLLYGSTMIYHETKMYINQRGFIDVQQLLSKWSLCYK